MGDAGATYCHFSATILPRTISKSAKFGEPAGTRTQDPRLKRAMLYRLSYRLTEARQSSLVNRVEGYQVLTRAPILPSTNDD